MAEFENGFILIIEKLKVEKEKMQLYNNIIDNYS
jgi:hypothetical protein